jgi:radical SAM protein with 4Fe4S-binding SPASM domain
VETGKTLELLKMGKMAWSLFEKITVEFAALMKKHNYVGDVGFCLMSEPFVEKDIIKYSKFILDHGIELTFTTNAALLTPDIVDQLIRIGFNGKFHISCHGIEEESYKRIMGISLTLVLDNIDYLISCYPKDKIHIRAFPFGWKVGEKRRVKKYWHDRGVKFAGGVATSRAGLIDKLEISPHKSTYGCDWDRPLWHMVISYNGDVRFCCMDMARETCMGNVAKQSLDEIWNGQVFNDYLKQVYSEKVSDEDFLCKRCEWATTWFSQSKISKIPRKIRRHFYKKRLEHLDLNEFVEKNIPTTHTHFG